MPARDLYWTGAIDGDGTKAGNYQLLDGSASGGAPVNGDSVYLYGARKVNAMTSGPGTVTLVVVEADQAYGAETICYEGMTAGTLTCYQQVMIGGAVTGTASFTDGDGTGMHGGTVANAIFSGASVLLGGTVTDTLAWYSTAVAGIRADDAAIDLSGCVIEAYSDMGIQGGANGVTTDADTVVRIAAASITVSLVSVDILGVLQASVAGGTYAFSTATLTGAVACDGAVTWTATGTCKITLNVTYNFAPQGTIPADLPIEVNGTDQTVTAYHGLTINSRVTVTAGTFDGGVFRHTFGGGFVQAGGAVAGTGVFDMTGTEEPLAITDAVTDLTIAVTAGSTTQEGSLSCKRLEVVTGANYDGALNTLTLADGILSGGGQITNVVAAAAYIAYCADGGTNDTGETITFRAPPQTARPGLVIGL